MSRTTNTATVGTVALNNVTNPNSGAFVANAQRAINELEDTVGMAGEGDLNRKVYSSTTVIADGDDRKVALGKLDAMFHGTTGHSHDGSDGQGPVIVSTSVGSVSLKGSFLRGTDLTGASGLSTDVSTEMTGKTASAGAVFEGVVVTAPNNRIIIRDPVSADQLEDGSGNHIYGRLTKAASVWTLSYFVDLAGVETAYSFASPQNIAWYYQELFNPITNAPVYSEIAVIPSDNATQDVIDATSSLRGLVSATTQSFGGSKTFVDPLVASSTVTAAGAVTFQTSYANQRLDVATTGTPITALSSTKSFDKFTGSTATEVQGIGTGADGKNLTVFNGSSASVTFKHQNTGASATDRIVTPDGLDLVLLANRATQFKYDSGQSRWVVSASVSNTANLANDTLSNLAAPTSVNQDLLPSGFQTRDLGSSLLSWDSTFFKEIFIAQSAGVNLASVTQTGNNLALANLIGGGNLSQSTLAASLAGSTGAFSQTTGNNSGAGTTGGMTWTIGTSSASTVGDFNFISGSGSTGSHFNVNTNVGSSKGSSYFTSIGGSTYIGAKTVGTYLFGNNGDPALTIVAAAPSGDPTRGHMIFVGTESMAAGAGASITLGGRWNTGGTLTGSDLTFFGFVKAVKLNGFAGDFNGELMLSGRSTGPGDNSVRIQPGGHIYFTNTVDKELKVQASAAATTGKKLSLMGGDGGAGTNIVGGDVEIDTGIGTGNTESKFRVKQSAGTVSGTGTNALSTSFEIDRTTVSVFTRKVTNVVDPSSAQDAATKNYVDASIGFAGDDSVVSVSSNYSVAAGVGVVLANTSGGSFTVTLPSAAANTNRRIVITKTNPEFNQLLCNGFAIIGEFSSMAMVSNGSTWTQVQGSDPWFNNGWSTYTPTFTGFGTVTVQEFFYSRVGQSIWIRGQFTSGISTATEAQVSLPNSWTTTTGSGLASTGFNMLGPVGKTGNSSTYFGNYVGVESTVTYLTFSQQSLTTSSVTKQNGNVIATVADVLTFTAGPIPILELTF